MDYGPYENKIQRLRAIESLLLDHPDGLFKAEIARSLSVHKSTIGRYLADLPEYIEEDPETGKWVLNRDLYPVTVRLDRHEALALHLAARMLALRTDHDYPKAASALRKLADALEKPAPLLGRHMKLSAAVLDQKTRKDGHYLNKHLEMLTSAWADGKKVQIGYRKRPQSRKSIFVLAPYFIEPNPVGQTTYLIGRVSPSGKMLTLKLERIEEVVILEEEYTIDPAFDPVQQMANAWGIWFTDSKPIDVVLCFSNRVADRVRETCWHPSEDTEPCNDGLIWKAKVAEPLEMLPWIRSWGADVEVLKPDGLRQAVAAEVFALQSVYKPASG